MSKDAIPHDGWRSRKVITAGVVLGTLTGIATGALFAGFADFDQWASFLQAMVASVLVPLYGALGLDKFAQAKAKEGADV